MKKLILLGSTGSIGRQATDVVRRMRSEFKIAGLATNSNLALLKKQVAEFRPEIVSIGSEEGAKDLSAWCRKNGIKSTVVYGLDGLIEVARYRPADLVLSAVVGSIGIKPLFEALNAGTNIALANKEALVVAGDLVMAKAKKKKLAIIPVDSEHSAIFQCMKDEDSRSVEKIILTASGGPFYRSKKKHSEITVADALAHPTWDMGPKITIDSATLMNKGLEAIEAHHLFGVPLKAIEIVIHPQSIVHSMVEFKDKCVLAQLSMPDMRLPIQHALTYPRRYPSALKTLDLAKVQRLEFGRPDFGRFRCLKLALSAGETGGTMPAVMNAANESAVAAFLQGQIVFTAIPKVIEKTMASHKVQKKPDLEEILLADAAARRYAQEIIQQHSI